MDFGGLIEISERISASDSAALTLAIILLFAAVGFLSRTVKRNREYLEAKIASCESNHDLCQKRLNRLYVAVASSSGGRRSVLNLEDPGDSH